VHSVSAPVSLLVDTRSATRDPFASDLRDFLKEWNDLEPILVGKSLRNGFRFKVQTKGLGDLFIEILSPIGETVIDSSTEFRIVTVIEERKVLPAYQCSSCMAQGEKTYGPFICAYCQGGRNRVCDDHGVLLPGSLTATCPTHRRQCEECGLSADVWCPGPRCRSNRSWCSAHSKAHQSDQNTHYCGPCYDELFPTCAMVQCRGTGYNTCSFVDSSGQACRARCCPRHTWRWQVFGPQRIGLALCAQHSSRRSSTAQETVQRILLSCALLRCKPPSLPGLVHASVKATGQSQDPDTILKLCLAVGSAAPASMRKDVGDMVATATPPWRKQLSTRQEAQAEKTAAVVAWLRTHGDSRAAEGLAVRNWSPPRDDRPGTLYVFCDARYFSRQARDQAAAALGFEIRIVR
jgi:hypothetical protein